MVKIRWMSGAALAVLLAGPVAAQARQVTSAPRRMPRHVRLEARLLAAAGAGDCPRRNPAGPEAARGLSRAGHLFYLAGQPAPRCACSSSRLTALDRGDVVFAANVLLQASAVATKAKDFERGKQLASRAELLSTSPLLSEGQRVAILEQISRR
jgi:hypothetical protein